MKSLTTLLGVLVFVVVGLWILFVGVREHRNVKTCEEKGGVYLQRDRVCVKKSEVIEL